MKKLILVITVFISHMATAELSSRVQPTKTEENEIAITIEKASFAKRSPIGIKARDKKKFLVVKVTIQNRKNSDLWVFPSRFPFVDHKNVQTKACTYHREALRTIKLMPQSKTSGYVMVEVSFFYKGGTLYFEYDRNKKIKINLPDKLQA